jgi:hydroxymethylbilane synthase
MPDARLRIATRGSPLARTQAGIVRDALAAADPALAEPGAIAIDIIRTTGDRMQQGPLSEIGGKGLFTKEIEEALAERRADIAVHSMKDVPTWLPDGLIIAAVLPREDPRDALIMREAGGLDALGPGAVIGTASLRRGAILLNKRPDLKIVTFRGNVETRLAKLEAGEVDATLLAAAGLNRLGLSAKASAFLSPDEMLPAVCQGIIGIECREDDDYAREVLAWLDHAPTAAAAACERAFLATLDGSCRTPIGGLAEVDGDALSFRGLIVRPDGSEALEDARTGKAADAAAIGRAAGEALRERAGPGFFDDG